LHYPIMSIKETILTYKWTREERNFYRLSKLYKLVCCKIVSIGYTVAYRP